MGRVSVLFCCSMPKRHDRVAPPERLVTTTSIGETPTPAAPPQPGIGELPAVVNGSADVALDNAALRTPNATADSSMTQMLHDQNNRAFVKALKAGDLAQVRTLLGQGVDIERRGMWENTPLLLACHYGHATVALELLQRGASPIVVNEKGCTPLLYACVESMTEARQTQACRIACDCHSRHHRRAIHFAMKL